MAPRLSLLLVEEDPDLALLMCRSLERAGHHVTVCGSAEAAGVVLHDSSFDLITVDQWLPGMQGLDLLQMLNREGSVTPTIMVAPLYDENLPAQALRAGALDFVDVDAGLSFLHELPERVSNAARTGASG